MLRAYSRTGRLRRIGIPAVFWVISALWAASPATAHELRPAIVNAELDDAGNLAISVSLNLEAQLAGIGPEHDNTAQSDRSYLYDRYRTYSAAELRDVAEGNLPPFIDGFSLTFDGAPAPFTLNELAIPEVGDVGLPRTSTILMQAPVPADARWIQWRAPPQLGETIVRISRTASEEPFFSALLGSGESSGQISLAGSALRDGSGDFRRYVELGFTHILPKGLDHILFIVGLFLLSARLRPLLWQVTGFTLAHSMTLALSLYGVVSLPAAIVEPLIALSIVYVAVENLFTDRLHGWRPAIVFGFGLLHGLGFAGVLSEIGLPESNFLLALAGFNIGVELGQIAVLAVCFLAVGFWFRSRLWYRRAFAMPASLLVALVASYWFIERIV